jgi:hypothetical protein
VGRVLVSRHITLVYLAYIGTARSSAIMKTVRHLQDVRTATGRIPTTYTNAHRKIVSLDDQAINVNLAVSALLRFGSTNRGGTESQFRCRRHSLRSAEAVTVFPV